MPRMYHDVVGLAWAVRLQPDPGSMELHGTLRVRIAVLVLSAWTALLAAACTSSRTSATAPTTSRCDVSLTSSLETVPPSGGSGTIAVTTDRDCTWAVSSDVNWITILSGSSGQGPGTASFRVAANTDAVARRATLAVNERSVALSQEAACRYAVTPTSITADAGGLLTEVRVEAGASCEWTVTSDADWVRVRGSGPGAGSVTVEVAANTGGPRTARVVVASQAVTVSQAGVTVAPCTYAIDPAAQTVPPAGGTVDVAVTTGPSCAWTASSNADWIAVTRNASGTGPATVTLAVTSNSQASRSGTVTIAGITFTVLQSPVPCAFALTATSTSVAAAGGNGSVGVTTTGGCGWVASSNASWLTVSSGASGTGNGTVAFTAAANPGAARSGTLTVAGLTFTVSQPAAPPVCTYALNPSSQAVGVNGGGSMSFAVTAGAGCAWTATVSTTAASWVTITSATGGTGNGTVTYRVDKNRGAPRTGTIQVATQAFTITQADR